MRCFFVLVHGRLCWSKSASADDVIANDRPSGFCCHRFVLAFDEVKAGGEAIRRVRNDLDRAFGWLSSGVAAVELEAEEVSVASYRKLLEPENKGHTFYVDNPFD